MHQEFIPRGYSIISSYPIRTLLPRTRRPARPHPFPPPPQDQLSPLPLRGVWWRRPVCVVPACRSQSVPPAPSASRRHRAPRRPPPALPSLVGSLGRSARPRRKRRFDAESRACASLDYKGLVPSGGGHRHRFARLAPSFELGRDLAAGPRLCVGGWAEGWARWTAVRAVGGHSYYFVCFVLAACWLKLTKCRVF